MTTTFQPTNKDLFQSTKEYLLENYSIKGLVELFNVLVQVANAVGKNEKPAKRFADRAQGVKRILKLQEYIREVSNVPVTQAEFIVLNACRNYDTLAGQLSDNYSNGTEGEFERLLGWNAQQVGGLVASLVKKGLVTTNEPDDEIIWLTGLGVAAVFFHIEVNDRNPDEVIEEPKTERQEVNEAVSKAVAKKKAEAKAQKPFRGTNIKPYGWKPIPCKQGTKQATIVDLLSRESGATMDQLLEALSGGNKPWTEITVRSGFSWDLKQKGYGVISRLIKDVAKGVEVETFFLVIPEGFQIPEHTARKTKKKAAKLLVDTEERAALSA